VADLPDPERAFVYGPVFAPSSTIVLSTSLLYYNSAKIFSDLNYVFVATYPILDRL